MEVTTGSLLDRMLEVRVYVPKVDAVQLVCRAFILLLGTYTAGIERFVFMPLQAVATCTKLTWLKLATPLESGIEVLKHATGDALLLVHLADSCSYENCNLSHISSTLQPALACVSRIIMAADSSASTWHQLMQPHVRSTCTGPWRRATACADGLAAAGSAESGIHDLGRRCHQHGADTSGGQHASPARSEHAVPGTGAYRTVCRSAASVICHLVETARASVREVYEVYSPYPNSGYCSKEHTQHHLS